MGRITRKDPIIESYSESFSGISHFKIINWNKQPAKISVQNFGLQKLARWGSYPRAADFQIDAVQKNLENKLVTFLSMDS